MSGRRRKKSQRRTQERGRFFRLSVNGVELARGFDGLFRGKPEPAFVLALYSGGGASAKLLSRHIVEVPMRAAKGFPATVVLPKPRVMDVALGTEGPLLLLAFAVEVDSRELLQHLYARVEQPDRFHAWRVSDPTPAPLELIELAKGHGEHETTAQRLNLLWDDQPLESIGDAFGDDYIGAAAIVLGGLGGARRTHRMHFASADERNDWTLEVNVGSRW